MHPFLQFGPVNVPTYGLLLAVAILVGVWMAVARAARMGLSRVVVYTSASVAVLAALLGAKLTDLLILRRVHTAAGLVSGAGTFLGGFLVAVIVTAIYARAVHAGLLRLADSFAPPLALGVAIVRLGCFAAGCDFGKPTALPWGVVFTDSRAAQFTGVPLGVRLHPSQLYESLLGLLIFALLLLLDRRPRRPGTLFVTFTLAYSSARFLLEFLRGDADRGSWGPLSTSQWLAIVTLALVSALYVTLRRQPVAAGLN